MKKVFTVLLALVIVLSLSGVASAAPLRNDESVKLSYANGVIKCVVRWNYEMSKVHSYDINVFKDYGTVDSTSVTLRRDSLRGRLVYTVVPTGSGVYNFDIYLQGIYGNTINSPTGYSITIP